MNKKTHTHSGDKIELSLFMVGLLSFIVALFIKDELTKTILFLLAFSFSGYHVMIDGVKSTIKDTISKKRPSPNIHLLMMIAAIGAIIIKEYREAALLILIFAGAHFLEHYVQNKSTKEISSLLKLNPTKARRITKEGTDEVVDVAYLNIGDILHVLPGDQVPTDGKVLSGEPFIDQALITGESIPVEKQVGDIVYGSTQNGNTPFTMEVTKDSQDTVFAKIVTLVQEAQSNLSKTATIIKKIEPIYVTIILLFAPLFYLLGLYAFSWGQSESAYRTMVFLIGASPCALAATAVPATLSALSNLAKRQVLFKGGSYLTNISALKVVAFDKTGTLTKGKPSVTDVLFDELISKKDKEKYLDIIVSMESESNHPLAYAILEHFQNRKTIKLDVTNTIGIGLHAVYENITYHIGKPSIFKEVSQELLKTKETLEFLGKTIIFFGTEKALGLIALLDVPKEEAKEAIRYFKDESVHTVMLTGDQKNTALTVGNALNIDEIFYNVLPDQKSHIIKDLKEKRGMTAMLGDGINDSPALVSADIGVAMGKGADIAIEVADAVLMKNDLSKFVYTHKLSKKLNKVVLENMFFSLGVIVFLIMMNILGLMHIGFAVLIHEGSTLLVTLNGLRLLKKIK